MNALTLIYRDDGIITETRLDGEVGCHLDNESTPSVLRVWEGNKHTIIIKVEDLVSLHIWDSSSTDEDE